MIMKGYYVDLFQLDYFVSIVEEGSISAAARKLHMSQPPLSLQIKKMEEEFGTLLFIRDGRQLIITEAGLSLYRRAKTLIDLSEVTKKEIVSMAQGVSGILRIGTISSAEHLSIREIILEFHVNRPDILFEVHEKNTNSLIDMLRNGELDAAFVRTPFPQENFQCIRLHNEAMVAVAHKSNFDSPNQITSLEWLSTKPLIIYRRWEGLIRNAFHEKGLEFCPICVCDDARTSISWASSKFGISLTPESAFESNHMEDLEAHNVSDLGIESCIMLAIKKNTDNKIAKDFFDIFMNDDEIKRENCNCN